jgi:hypothetical protein
MAKRPKAKKAKKKPGAKRTKRELTAAERRKKSCEEVDEERRDFIRRHLIQGLPHVKITDLCLDNPIFRSQDFREEELSRASILKMIGQVRTKARKVNWDLEQEFHDSYQRLLAAHRMATEQGDPKALANIEREIRKLVGLTRQPPPTPPTEAGEVLSKLKAMWASIPVPDEADPIEEENGDDEA